MGATVAFGLAASSQTIDIIVKWKDKIPSTPDGWIIYLSMFVGFIQVHSIEATLVLYLGLIVVVFILLVWSFFPLHNRKQIIQKDQSRSAKTPGFKWPWKIKIFHYGTKDNEKGSDKTEK